MSLNQREHSSFQQTNAHSCVGAALLVALHDMTNFPLKQEREQQIWNFARGTDQGSLPGRLALFANHRPVQVEVLNDRQRMQELRGAILSVVPRDQMDFDPDRIMGEHEIALQEAAEAGLKVTEEPITVKSLLQKLQSGKALIAVIVGNPPEQPLGLHWLLLQSYQRETDELTIMDPAHGENFTYPGKTYIQSILEGSFIGSAIALSPRKL